MLRIWEENIKYMICMKRETGNKSKYLKCCCCIVNLFSRLPRSEQPDLRAPSFLPKTRHIWRPKTTDCEQSWNMNTHENHMYVEKNKYTRDVPEGEGSWEQRKNRRKHSTTMSGMRCMDRSFPNGRGAGAVSIQPNKRRPLPVRPATAHEARPFIIVPAHTRTSWILSHPPKGKSFFLWCKRLLRWLWPQCSFLSDRGTPELASLELHNMEIPTAPKIM